MIAGPRKNGPLARLFVPSIASAAVHLTLLAVVLAATVTIASRPTERPRLTDVAIAPHAPPQPEQAPQPPAPVTPGARPSPQAPSVPALSSRSTAAAGDAQPSLPTPRSVADSIAIEPASPARVVSFAGVSAQAARRVVYVVDVSGSMASSYAFVRARLAQSISRLSPTQRFQVILVRGLPDTGADVQMLPNPDVKSNDPLVRALPGARENAITWLRAVVVGGRSDPIAGLERALTLQPAPDVVFFLARGFKRSGPNSEWGQGVDATLDSLDRLNPPARRTALRPVVIKTIQFLDDDPTGLMRAVAAAHGDGPGSFRVLTIDDLADEGADDAAIPRDRQQDADVRRAREALRSPGSDDLHVLYGIATAEQASRVREAMGRADDALSRSADDESAAPVRARLLLLESALNRNPDAARRAGELLDALFVVDADADAARRLMLAHALARAGRGGQAAAVADALASDIPVLGLPESIAGELAVLRTRFALGSPLLVRGEWGQIAAEAESRRRLDDPVSRPRAFEPLLSWAGVDPQRQHAAWNAVVAATEGIDDLAEFPPDVRFARAMSLASTRPGEAIAALLDIARSPGDAAAAREALWEAAVLARDAADPRAATLLERFATTHPRDARAVDALAVALSLATGPDDARRTPLLRHLLDVAPDHASSDTWRLELAGIADADEALDVLAGLAADSPLAGPAADLACARLDGLTDPTLLRAGTTLLESLGDARAPTLRARLVEALIPVDPDAALDALQRLDPRTPELTLLRARALLAGKQTDAALASLQTLATTLSPDRPEHWQAWTLLLETLAHDGAQSDALRAHLFRLRLLDPDLGGEPWRTRVEHVATALEAH